MGCSNYCGVACIDGSCPIALEQEYEEYGIDKVKNCEECPYYKGCEDCINFNDHIRGYCSVQELGM